MRFQHTRLIRKFSTARDKPCYVTTPIFYVNASPHIGHLYSAVISDAICRYNVLKHPNTPSLLTTGTDEHGTKIQQAAANHKIAVSDYCDKISSSYRHLFNLANIKYSDFIRTTEDRHIKAVKHFWNQLKAKDRIYSTTYGGWYCVSDEIFLTDSQLKENENGVKVSAESGHPVEWTEEENYMFKLSMHQEDVMYWIKQGNRIKPSKFEKILLDYLNEPLPDVSISRPSSRVHWGITVPDDDTQTIYVWLDALVNYLTSAGYPESKFTKTWPASLHVIGKDILKFHGIYWPAFLIAAGLEPPEKLLVHSHWTVDGQKMSKSKFNVVDPIERSQTYTMEGLRYFLLREGVPHSDGNYSETKILRILNSELADTLGNLLSRTCAKSLNPRQVFPELHPAEFNELLKEDYTKRLIEALNELPDKSAQHYDSYNFYLVVDQVMAVLHAANNFFESAKPWELKNPSRQQSSFRVATIDSHAGSNDANEHKLRQEQDQQNIENCRKLETIITITMETLRVCAIILQPIIPGFTEKLLDKLNVDPAERYWLHTKQLLWKQRGMSSQLDNVVEWVPASLPSSTGKSLGNNAPVLFQRIVLDTKTPTTDKARKKVKKVSKT